MIATSTKVDISGVNVEKFDDKYFAKEVEKKKTKGEGQFFEAEKEVSFVICFVYVGFVYQICSSLQLLVLCLWRSSFISPLPLLWF